MTTAREWLTANQNKYSDRIPWIKDCVKELGISSNTVSAVAKTLWPVRPTIVSTKESEEDSGKDVISPDEFLSQIDVVAKVLRFLNETVKDGYIEDDKLRKRFEISMPRWKEMVRLPILEGRGLTYEYSGGRRRTVWSSAAGIESAKRTISMARYES